MTRNWTHSEKLDRRTEGHLSFSEGYFDTYKIPGTWAQPKYCFSIDAILSTDHREAAKRSAYSQQILASKPSHAPLQSPYGYIPARALYQQQLHQRHIEPCHRLQPHHTYETELYDGSIGYPNHMTSRGAFGQKTCRRIRTIFTTEQLRKLEEVFSKQRYMTGTEKVLLASALRLTETQIKVWFQNRRTKWRKSQEDQAQSSICSEEEEFISVDSDDSL